MFGQQKSKVRQTEMLCSVDLNYKVRPPLFAFSVRRTCSVRSTELCTSAAYASAYLDSEYSLTIKAKYS